MKKLLAKKIVTCKSNLYKNRRKLIQAREKLNGTPGYIFLPLL